MKFNSFIIVGSSIVLAATIMFFLSRDHFSIKTPSSSDSSQQSISPTISPIPLIPLSDAYKQGTKTYSNSKIHITFEYPSYFQTRDIDVQEENTEWAQKYKNDPNVRQPRYKGTFATVLFTPEQSATKYILVCENKMAVFIQQYDNPHSLSLYDFIADLNKEYSGDGIVATFDLYKKMLTSSSLPKSGSYIFDGVIGENPVKQVYFTNKNEVYMFQLIGNCNTGGRYTPDAEAIFDKMLKSIKYM